MRRREEIEQCSADGRSGKALENGGSWQEPLRAALMQHMPGIRNDIDLRVLYLGVQPKRVGLCVKQLIAGSGNYPDRDGNIGVSTIWEQCRRRPWWG
ncbi:hypothetical protein ACVDG5_036850 [Mesorhizobium sp. ORM6]